LKRGWDVWRNVGGTGFDLVAHRERVQRRIEVKSTDPSERTGTTRRQLTVTLTRAEREHADHVIYYIHGHGTYFVIPKKAFPSSGSITVRVGKDGQIRRGTQYEQWRENWASLE